MYFVLLFCPALVAFLVLSDVAGRDVLSMWSAKRPVIAAWEGLCGGLVTPAEVLGRGLQCPGVGQG